ncbi:MAG: hypothetical protein J6P74_07980 [Paludibacteraceae bacterium]|nr:hypothetical protein [Paludibacteraceae bacterium]
MNNYRNTYCTHAVRTALACIIAIAFPMVPCSCRASNQSTNNARLLSVKDADEFMIPRGVDPSHEVPCPEFDTMEEAEAMFAQSGLNYCFCKFIADHPATMDYAFSTLQWTNNMPLTIADAPDGSIRIYGWDNHMGGTCTNWSAIYQIRDKGKVYTYEGLPDWPYDNHLIAAIYQLPHPKRHLYLFDTYFREWSTQSYNGFVAYERIGHELKRVPIIRNEEGKLVSEIGFEYDVPEFFFHFARTLTWDYLYDWDTDNNILYFPVPRGDYHTSMTDRFVRYQWNTKTLEPTDTVANPRLYPPLRNYVVSLQHTKASYVQVRVDSMADGRLRYAAWDRDQDISTIPNIVVYGERKGDEFHFYNPPSYTYVVTIDDHPEVRVYYGDSIGHLGEPGSVYSEY